MTNGGESHYKDEELYTYRLAGCDSHMKYFFGDEDDDGIG